MCKVNDKKDPRKHQATGDFLVYYFGYFSPARRSGIVELFVETVLTYQFPVASVLDYVSVAHYKYHVRVSYS